jgi:hypothetical protein
MRIRKAVEADVPKLLPLMHELAEFERYANDFAVTEEVLREQGFRRSPPDFHCLIAERDAELVGFLVYYFVPFNYRAKPNLIIKELYVGGGYRSRGVGMNAASSFTNGSAATIDPNWHEFQMSEKAFQDLAASWRGPVATAP